MRPGSATNQTRADGLGLPQRDERQPLVPVRRHGDARRQDRRRPLGGAPRAGVHRDRVDAIAAVRGRRHVVERAEDRRPLARVVHRRRQRLHQADRREAERRRPAARRAGSPSTAAIAA